MHPISTLFKIWFSIFCIDGTYFAKINVQNNTKVDVRILNNFPYYNISSRERIFYDKGYNPTNKGTDGNLLRIFDPKNKCEISRFCEYKIPYKKNGEIKHGKKTDLRWNLLSKSGVLGDKYKRRTWAMTDHLINKDILKRKNIVLLKRDSVFSDTIQLPNYIFYKKTYTCEEYSNQCTVLPVDTLWIEIINQFRYSIDLENKPRDFNRIVLVSDTVKVKLE